MSDSIRGGYLNNKQAKDGSWYLEGNLGGFVIRIYENKYRRSEQDPSHVWYFSGKPKGQAPARQAQGGSGFAPRGSAPKNYAPQAPPPQVTQAPMPTQQHAPSSGEMPQWDDQDPNYPQF